ncbi:MAG: tRNA (guanosine(46)-N7)-methyltransferase TrmB [bacterium]|nr:tRNA (guanosine(46)-N7)-methyltransferase TrmB [bacterium]
MVKTIYEYDPVMDDLWISPGDIDERLDFQAIFGNDAPVEIEIGCGKGRFILAECQHRPEVNFIAIERSLKIIRIALLRAAKFSPQNLRFLCLDADFTVKLLIKSRSVTAYHVYFPDPWPKDRHHKRRLFNPRLLQKMAETLLPQGKLKLKSDHAEYYNDACDRILDSGLFERVSEHQSHEVIEDFDEADRGASHYEIKWRKEAKTIFSSEFQVKSQSNLSEK